MNTVTERELKSYQRQIKKALATTPEETQKMLCGFQCALDEYVERNPGATLNDIQKHFGKPDEVASEYLSTLTPLEVRHWKHWKQLIWVLALALILVTIFFSVVYGVLMQETPGIIHESEKYTIPTTDSSTIIETY